MNTNVKLKKHVRIIHSPRSFLQGDIINWDRDEWDLRSPWNTSVSELLDLERDVCNMNEEGLILVPQKLSFQESLHVCGKLAGRSC